MKSEDLRKDVLTIPNILSIIRILLIPVIIYLYYARSNFTAAAVVLIISGLTDMADGYIARHFNMISNVGKIIDPAADKLTQAATLFCLITRFPLMLIPLILLFIKEIVSAVFGLVVMKSTKRVYGALWHGKVTTILLYIVMTLHILWIELPAAVSNATIIICVVMMVVSFILYTAKNVKELRRFRDLSENA